jgi:hypothetical protein
MVNTGKGTVLIRLPHVKFIVTYNLLVPYTSALQQAFRTKITPMAWRNNCQNRDGSPTGGPIILNL